MTDNSTRMWWRGTLLGGEGSVKSGWRVKGEERSGVEPTMAWRPGGRSRVWVSLQKQSIKMYSWQRDKTELETWWGINWNLVGEVSFIHGSLEVEKILEFTEMQVFVRVCVFFLCLLYGTFWSLTAGHHSLSMYGTEHHDHSSKYLLLGSVEESLEWHKDEGQKKNNTFNLANNFLNNILTYVTLFISY